MSSSILPFTEANSKRVASLFRRALRTAFDSSLKFDAYRNETIKIRAQFEANKNINNPADLEEAIARTERKLRMEAPRSLHHPLQTRWYQIPKKPSISR